MAKQAGQKYIVITYKHHDGFAMWPTAVNRWNIRDHSGFQRDILRELKTAATANGIKLGLLLDLGLARPRLHRELPRLRHQDEGAAPGARHRLRPGRAVVRRRVDREQPGQPVDRAERRGSRAVRPEHRPQAVINNRVGKRRAVDGDFGTPEQALAGSPPSIQLNESCITINNTWGYAAWDTNFKSPTTMVRDLATPTSNGANLLLNIGPTDTGAVTAGQSDGLRGIGNWMAGNGTAIHGAGHTGLVAQPGWGRVTRKGDRLYLIVSNWAGTLHLPSGRPSPSPARGCSAAAHR